MKLVVDGMTCGHCVRTITGAIKQLDPSATVEIELETGEVSIAGDLDVAAVVKAIGAEGYPVVAILDVGNATAIPAQTRRSCCGTCIPEEAVRLD